MKEGRFENPPLEKTPGQIILERWQVTAGKKVKLLKRQAEGDSDIKVGQSIEGVLDADLKTGEPISLDNGSRTTTSIHGVAEQDGRLLLKTRTSVYELVFEKESENNKTLTLQDLQREIDIFSANPKYGEWSAVTGQVLPEDSPYNKLFLKNGMSAGQKIVFFSDGKERQGIIEEDPKGNLILRDAKGLPWGIYGILHGGGYVKKA